MKRKKLPKSDWLPAVLAIYFIVMAAIFVPTLIRAGEYLRVALISVVEIAVLIALRIFLRKREALNK